MLLRTPRLDDAEAVFKAYASDVEVTRFLPWSAHGSVEDTRAYLQQRIDGAGEATHAYWALTSDGGVLGIIGLRFEGSEAEIGFVVARPLWNRGYATEALQAVLEVARETGRFQRVLTCVLGGKKNGRKK